MPKKKTKYSTDFKTRVAVAALKEDLTLSQLTSKYKVHSTQVRAWKSHAVEAIKDCFNKKSEKDKSDQDNLISSLYEQIGRLQTELNWMKKKCGFDY